MDPTHTRLVTEFTTAPLTPAHLAPEAEPSCSSKEERACGALFWWPPKVGLWAPVCAEGFLGGPEPTAGSLASVFKWGRVLMSHSPCLPPMSVRAPPHTRCPPNSPLWSPFIFLLPSQPSFHAPLPSLEGSIHKVMAPSGGWLKGQDIVALRKSLTSKFQLQNPLSDRQNMWSENLPSSDPPSWSRCCLFSEPKCSHRKVLSINTQSLAHLYTTGNHCPDFYPHRLMSVLELHMDRLKHAPFCIWILSFNTVSVRFIHLAACIRELFFPMVV